MQKFYIRASLLKSILNTFRYDGIEHGGLLFCKEREIVGFYFDKEGFSDAKSYYPGKGIPTAISKAYKRGLGFIFVHCHPYREGHKTILSYGDIRFAKEFLKYNLGWENVIMALISGRKMYLYGITECDCTEYGEVATEER